MTTYTPTNWVIIEIDKDLHKILAGWRTDSWQLNSGITKIEETDTDYLVYGYSGSIYICHKDKEHLSLITQGIFDDFQKAYPSIQIVKMKDVLSQYLETVA